MKNRVFNRKIFRIIVIFPSLAMLLIAWFALHDMQRAEGVGLFYSSVLGIGEASQMGMLAEAVGMLALLVLLLLPCILFHRLASDCFLRMLTAYLAYMPSISLAYLVHLLNGTEDIKCSEALLTGHLGQAFREGTAEIMPVLATGIPLLILAAFVLNEKAETKEVLKRKIFLKWIPVAVVLGILLVFAVTFPLLKEICTFFVRYLLLLYGFFLWEYLYEVQPQYKKWGWIIFSLFGLRGIYIMAEVLNVYHI